MVDYKKLLASALTELFEAQELLVKETVPLTGLPRFRRFVFAQKKDELVYWPAVFKDGMVASSYFSCEGKNVYKSASTVSAYILDFTGQQPRLVLRALRRIQAATSWCEARTEGRKRAAEEILRQQKRFLDILEAEEALAAIK